MFQGERIFPFSKAFRRMWGSTQPRTHRVPGGFRQGREADYKPTLRAGVECMDLHLQPPTPSMSAAFLDRESFKTFTMDANSLISGNASLLATLVVQPFSLLRHLSLSRLPSRRRHAVQSGRNLPTFLRVEECHLCCRRRKSATSPNLYHPHGVTFQNTAFFFCS